MVRRIIMVDDEAFEARLFVAGNLEILLALHTDIATAAELVGLLATAPARLTVETVERGGRYYVADGATVVASIAEDSEAAALLKRACNAEIAEDLEAWMALPLRYGPACSQWVHASHPSVQQPLWLSLALSDDAKE
jgi:hypothetical protein